MGLGKAIDDQRLGVGPASSARVASTAWFQASEIVSSSPPPGSGTARPRSRRRRCGRTRARSGSRNAPTDRPAARGRRATRAHAGGAQLGVVGAKRPASSRPHRIRRSSRWIMWRCSSGIVVRHSSQRSAAAGAPFDSLDTAVPAFAAIRLDWDQLAAGGPRLARSASPPVLIRAGRPARPRPPPAAEGRSSWRSSPSSARPAARGRTAAGTAASHRASVELAPGQAGATAGAAVDVREAVPPTFATRARPSRPRSAQAPPRPGSGAVEVEPRGPGDPSRPPPGSGLDHRQLHPVRGGVRLGGQAAPSTSRPTRSGVLVECLLDRQLERRRGCGAPAAASSRVSGRPRR